MEQYAGRHRPSRDKRVFTFTFIVHLPRHYMLRAHHVSACIGHAKWCSTGLTLNRLKREQKNRKKKVQRS